MKKSLIIYCLLISMFLVVVTLKVGAFNDERDIYENDAFSQKIQFRLSQEYSPNIYKELNLAGLSQEKDSNSPLIVLRWNRVLKRGVYQWQLQLAAREGILPAEYIDGTDDEGFAFINLESDELTRLKLGNLYEANFSLDFTSGEISILLNDLSEEVTLFSAYLEVEFNFNDFNELYPITSWELQDDFEKSGEEVVVEKHIDYLSEYKRVGLPLNMRRDFEWRLTEGATSADEIELPFPFGLASKEDGVYSFPVLDEDKKPGLFIQWPQTELTGQVKLIAYKNGEKITVFNSKWKEENELKLISSKLPRGESELVFKYIDGKYEKEVGVIPVKYYTGNYSSLVVLEDLRKITQVQMESGFRLKKQINIHLQ